MDDVDRIRAVYEAWNSGDIEPALLFMHPGVEWFTSGVFPGLEPIYRGHDGVRRFRDDLTAPFASFVIRLEDVRAEEAAVEADVHFDAIGATSGVRVQLDFINEWRFEHGLIVSFRSRPRA